MRFEFDAAKSAVNKAKHGIDFVEAQALWLDPDRIEGPGRSIDEPRFQIVGQIGGITWTATVTYRHEETIRIISVRRARPDEKAQYEEGSAEDDHG
ncbi:MAG TPA: BrnT family toxin [Vicinamibacterales bacterium]